MYVILGASGQVGGAALAALAHDLADKPHTIRALSRRRPVRLPAGVEWRSVDGLDTDALSDALTGATAAFVLNPVPIDAADVFEATDQWSRSVAEALARARPDHVVALSSQGAHLAEGTGVIRALHRFEQALRQTGVSTTVVRPSYFMESWLPVLAPALQTGELPAFRLPVEQPFDTISAGDVGRLVADLLQAPRAADIVNATGPRQYAEVDAAAIVARLSGRSINVSPVPPAAREGALIEAGLSLSYARELAAMYAALDNGAAAFESAAATHYGTTTLDRVLAAALENPA